MDAGAAGVVSGVTTGKRFTIDGTIKQRDLTPSQP